MSNVRVKLVVPTRGHSTSTATTSPQRAPDFHVSVDVTNCTSSAIDPRRRARQNAFIASSA
jgi:hypothetical protein